MENEDLIKRIEKLEEIVSKRSRNQVQLPLDKVSKDVLNISGIPVGTGVNGTFGTQVVGVVSGSVTVPAQPSGTIKARINGKLVELLIK